MNDFIRRILLNTFSLFIVSSVFPGLIVPPQLFGLLWASLVFTLVNQLSKPIIKLLLLPFNLVTLGLFRWVSNVIVLFLLTRFINTVKVIAFISPPFAQAGFSIPPLHISLFLSYIFCSVLLGLFYDLLSRFLIED